VVQGEKLLGCIVAVDVRMSSAQMIPIGNIISDIRELIGPNTSVEPYIKESAHKSKMHILADTQTEFEFHNTAPAYSRTLNVSEESSNEKRGGSHLDHEYISKLRRNPSTQTSNSELSIYPVLARNGITSASSQSQLDSLFRLPTGSLTGGFDTGVGYPADATWSGSEDVRASKAVSWRGAAASVRAERDDVEAAFHEGLLLRRREDPSPWKDQWTSRSRLQRLFIAGSFLAGTLSIVSMVILLVMSKSPRMFAGSFLAGFLLFILSSGIFLWGIGRSMLEVYLAMTCITCLAIFISGQLPNLQ
jgi:hypothetical protein